MRQPRSYVVRIYRQGARNITGMVENVHSGEQRSFSSVQELWNLLRRPTVASARRSAPHKLA